MDVAAFEPKLTETMKARIFDEALKGAKTSALAKEYGVAERTISKIKYDPKRLERCEKTLTAHQRFAKLRIHKGAMKGVEKEHEILDREVPEGEKGTSLLYLQHQVATSFMDRDGLKAPDKSEQRMEVVFSSGDLDVGMPEEDAQEEGTQEP